MDNFFTNLKSNYGVIKVGEANVSKFLQGQLTCNLNDISDLGIIGARCNAKGRVVSICYIFYADNSYYLVLPTDLLAKQQQDLAKYGLFSRCTVEACNDFAIFAIYDANNLSPHISSAHIIKISANLFMVVCAKNQEHQTTAQLNTNYANKNLKFWYLAQIQAGIAHINLQTSEKFVAQMLNLQAINAISFNKGCYMGQEVIARMQYLGQAKRRLYRLQVNASNCNIGDELFNADNKTVGSVILPVNLNDEKQASFEQNLPIIKQQNNYELLAVLDNKATNQPIYLNNQQVKILDLPYELDAKN